MNPYTRGRQIVLCLTTLGRKEMHARHHLRLNRYEQRHQYGLLSIAAPFQEAAHSSLG